MTRASYAGGQRYAVTWTGDNLYDVSLPAGGSFDHWTGPRAAAFAIERRA